MVSLCRVVLTVFVTSLGVTAQPSARKWAGASEYNLATEAFQERDANQQMSQLRRHPQVTLTRCVRPRALLRSDGDV